MNYKERTLRSLQNFKFTLYIKVQLYPEKAI